jgi:hypothetical protein
MRSRFALALALPVILVSAAEAFERHELHSGDSALGTILLPSTYDEYPILAARGSSATISIAKSGAGAYQPTLGFYDDDYSGVPVIPTSASSVRSAPLDSGQYRILVGGQGGTVGDHRVRVSLVPAMRFTMAATAAAPVSTLTFGAYPGFDATITLKWKGPAPVTLVSVTGPDAAAVTSAAPPKSTASTFQQGGYHATALGDYVVTVDAPSGTLKWSATVQLSGRLPRGTSHDFRVKSAPDVPGVEFPAFGRSPIAAIAGESGGPNDCVLSAAGSFPNARFLDGGAGNGGCSGAARDPGSPATTYVLFCVDGFFADIVGVTRDGDGHVTSYEAPSVRSPAGSGSATLSNITQDSQGRPTGWTEVRHFDATGRSYELVFSDAEYFTAKSQSNGYCKAFRVVERLLPDGVPRTYDYAPLR